MARILLIDDDIRLAQLLTRLFEPEGLLVDTATDGLQGVRRATSEVFDLVVLDVMLPGVDGFEALRRIRSMSDVPVVMLTAKGTEHDRIVGLELGADDYVPKPFNARELVARVKAVIRRTQQRPTTTARPELLSIASIEMDPGRREVRVEGQSVRLTTTEFDLLKCFMKHPGQVLSRDAIMDMLRGVGYAAYDRSIDVHVKNLRAKIEEDSRQPKRIKTVWGTGYMLVVDSVDSDQ